MGGSPYSAYAATPLNIGCIIRVIRKINGYAIASNCLREEVFVIVPGLAVYIIRLRFAGGIAFWPNQARINPSS